MERLTEIYGKNHVKIKGCSSIYPHEERKGANIQNVVVRLAAYEDLGRTPEELASYIAEVERLRDVKTALENDVYNYEMNLSHVTKELEALREAALWISKEASNNA